MITDKELLKIYMKGWTDELNSVFKNEFTDKLKNIAYKFGGIDAIVGDEVSSVDYKTEEDIIKEIRNE